MQEGGSSFPEECGVRYSLTFRRIISRPRQSPIDSPSPTIVPVPVPEPIDSPSPTIVPVPKIENGDAEEKEQKKEEEDEDEEENHHLNCYNALVFGSSLTKGLKVNLLLY